MYSIVLFLVLCMVTLYSHTKTIVFKKGIGKVCSKKL